MSPKRYRRIPRHIGFIPDGNRRWAQARGFAKAGGYQHGVDPSLAMFDLCAELGVRELTGYGFTQDNTRRAADQTAAFQAACVEVVQSFDSRDATVLVVGDAESRMFPRELLPFTEPRVFGTGAVRTNLLINYGWEWDLAFAARQPTSSGSFAERIASARISRIDLIIRWGGRQRLSGFLPVQSVYADMFVIDALWPDFQEQHVHAALEWYQDQDPTLGG